MKTPAARLLGSALTPEYIEAVYPLTPDDVSVQPAPRLLRLVWGPKTMAMTLGRRVFVDPAVLEESGPGFDRLLRHEMVHARQWVEEGTVGFLRRYLLQYLVARLAGASHDDAYHSIDLETEARRLSGL